MQIKPCIFAFLCYNTKVKSSALGDNPMVVQVRFLPEAFGWSAYVTRRGVAASLTGIMVWNDSGSFRKLPLFIFV